MPIRVECPNPKCKKTLQAPDDHAGKKARCPGCGHIITIPEPGTVLMEVHGDPLVGSKLGILEIKEKLGQGGMGAVYMAINTSLDRMVAVKVLPEELVKNTPTFLDRFRREAKMAAKLTHPNAVIIYSVGEDQGRHFIEMEYVQGKDLRQVIQEQGRVELKEASRIIVDAARALGSAHKQDIVHRDIKPDNIMLTEEGQVKVADFGLARVSTADSSITMSGQIMGTPLYMSPEQGQGQPTDGRTDIYSLGATYYHALVGLPPFTADTPLQVMMKHATEPLVWPSDVDIPTEVRAIVEKMMAKDPAQRYGTCDEAIADIEQFFKPKPVMGKVVQAAAPAAQPVSIATPPKSAYAMSADELAAIESAGRSIRRTMPGGAPAPAKVSGPKWVVPLAITSVLAILLVVSALLLFFRLEPAKPSAPVANAPETPPEGKSAPPVKKPEGPHPYETYTAQRENGSHDGTYVAASATGDRIPHPLSRKTYTIQHDGKTIDVPEGMVYVPAGPFLMGKPNSDRYGGFIQKEVCLDAYFIGKYEVTNAEYMAFV